MRVKHPSPSLSLVLGTRVLDGAGTGTLGRVVDVAVMTGAEAGQVAGIVVRRGRERFWVSAPDVAEHRPGQLRLQPQAHLEPLRGDESFVLLREDLLDRQIVDVFGRKVVRVNDVDLQWRGDGPGEGPAELRVREVEVGLRGAVRRLLVGLLPRETVASLAAHVAPRVIPWDFVNLIEPDPARRVRLKLSHERLAELHPSDIAAILEDLAPTEREALFSTLDEGVAAHALEESDPAMQKALVASLDSERAASIVEEMDPEAAADMLAELPPERTESILHEMDAEEREDVQELLEFREDTAAGRMTTDYVSLPVAATVAQAVEALGGFEGILETITEVYLLDERGALKHVVPLARIVLAEREAELRSIAEKRHMSVPVTAHDREVAELFDRYNLRALPVVDADGLLMGVVEADHVIAFLREGK